MQIKVYNYIFILVDELNHHMDQQRHHHVLEEELEEQVIVDDNHMGPVQLDDEFGDYLDVPYEDEEELQDFEDDDNQNQPGNNSASRGRAHKSLGLLTQRFIRFLQNAPTGMVDLNVVRTFS